MFDVLSTTKKCKSYTRTLGTSGMLLSLCKEIVEETGKVPSLPTEGGADYQNHPSLGSEIMIEGLHPASKLLAFAFGLIFPRQYVVCMSAKKAVEKALKMLGLSTKGGEDHPNYQSPGSQMMIKGLILILTMSAFAFGLSFVMLWHSLHCPSILACRKAKHVFKTQFSTITIFYTYTKENEKIF